LGLSGIVLADRASISGLTVQAPTPERREQYRSVIRSPFIVYSIICLLWFGLNDLAAIVAIGTAAFPAVSISIWQGIKGIDTQLVSMGQAFRLSNGAILRKIIFPQLLPHILASMRYALGICWKICTTVELIGMSSGVGYQLNYWFGLFSMAQVFAWTLLFLLVMFAIEYLLFKPVEKRLTRWRTGVMSLQYPSASGFVQRRRPQTQS